MRAAVQFLSLAYIVRDAEARASNNELKCVGVRGLTVPSVLYDDINGDWIALDGESNFTRNGWFLYQVEGHVNSTRTVEDQILWALKFHGIDGVYAVCISPYITQCSKGSWLAADGFGQPVDDDDAEVYDCETSTCSNSSCVSIQGLSVDRDERNLNGQWTPAGCYNAEPYYTSVSVPGLYLCYNSDNKRYIITEELCRWDTASRVAYSGSQTADLMASDQMSWRVSVSNDYEVGAAVEITRCAANAKREITEVVDEVSTSPSLMLAVVVAVVVVGALIFGYLVCRRMCVRSVKPQQIVTDDDDEVDDEEMSTPIQIGEELDHDLDEDPEIEIEIELQVQEMEDGSRRLTHSLSTESFSSFRV